GCNVDFFVGNFGRLLGKGFGGFFPLSVGGFNTFFPDLRKLSLDTLPSKRPKFPTKKSTLQPFYPTFGKTK
ncbi:MAG: hypothetical protein ACKPJ4_01535, partial [Dolichospermum sp.]